MYHFAPYNTMGAVRASKTAKYLMRAGHSVRVVSARSQGLPETLELEIPSNLVSWTPWMGIREASGTVRSHMRCRVRSPSPNRPEEHRGHGVSRAALVQQEPGLRSG